MEVSKQRLSVFICTFFVAIFVCLELSQYHGISTLFYKGIADVHSVMRTVIHATEINETITLENSTCHDVGTGMMRGRWKTRPLTSIEKTEIESFLASVRTKSMPESMQRNDGRCGNVSYENSLWFRALCNPKGPTPCCYNDRCVNKSPDECHCSKCYDLRTQIHAKYSTWEPEDPDCQVKNFTTRDACHLLQGAHLTVVGNSLMRHFYTALLLILSNNSYDGALQPNLPKKIHDQCTGMYIFTEKVCRKHIKMASLFCNAHTQVNLVGYFLISLKKEFVALIRNLLRKPKTFIFVSIGPHDSYNRLVYKEFLLPAIQMLHKEKTIWPKLIWATTHKFGILKTPLVPEQEWESVQAFNNFMKDKLRQHNVPVFDTFNLTSGVMSPDGAHFGLGINVMKVQMFLNFFQELKVKEQW